MNVFARLLCGAWFFTACTAHAANLLPQLSDLAAHVMPSVVSIASTDPIDAKSPSGSDDQDDGGGDDGSSYHKTAATSGTVIPPPKAEEALGSGFVFDPAGYILTNNHVIEGAASVTVTFQDGTILPAIIVGRDKDADLAVLKVAAGHRLQALSFGDSGKLRVGDWVLAIGNPFGLPGSTSAGIVSALDRNINSGNYDDFIQTDAAINKGNSGGPLFDMNGEVIGVNSAIYSPSGASDGIGFAIPSAMAAPVAQALKVSGAMTRGWLGAATQEVTPDIEKALGLPNPSGALVGAVSPDGPAAGKLQPGDVIVSLAGVPVRDARALLIRTAEIPVGEKASVKFWRDGREQQASLRITVPPAAVSDVVATASAQAPANVKLPCLGLAVSGKPADGGVPVTAASGPAAKAGIVAGDLIEQVAGVTVATAGDLQTQVKRLTDAKLPAATLLVSGDLGNGSNPGPRWVPVAFQGTLNARPRALRTP